ncbi:hypothetical protein GX645_07245 [Candidatus Sumerlaeota bacterium]|nr:hypothetical protein [Candidatus Sumerlaeota bacterium]
MIRLRLLLSLFVAVLFCCSGSLVAKEVTVENSGVYLTVNVTPETILRGEPVWLSIKVFNQNGLKMQDFSSRFNFPEGGDVNVTIRKKGELPFRYTAGEEARLFIEERHSIMLGQGFTRDMMIMYDDKTENGLVFDKAGYYNLRAEVKVFLPKNDQMLVADTGLMTIRVLAPSIGEKKSLDMLSGKELVRSLQTGNAETSEVAHAFQNYMDAYPNGPLAPLCSIALLGSYMTATPPENDRAMHEGLNFLLRWPNHKRSSEVIFMLAGIAAQKGDMDMARAWFFYLQDTDPTCPYINKDNTVAYGLFYGCVPKGQTRRWYQYTKPWDFSAAIRQ